MEDLTDAEWEERIKKAREWDIYESILMDWINKEGIFSMIDIETSNIPTGFKIGNWTVIKHSEGKDPKRYYYLCRCICGREFDIQGSQLKYGKSTQCKICARDLMRNRTIKDRDNK